MRVRILSVLLVTSVVLVACGSDDSSDTADTTTPAASTDAPATTVAGGVTVPAELAGTSWVIDGRITVGGLQDVPEGADAGLDVGDDGRISVRAGCNTGSTSITAVDGDVLTLSPLILTRMACSEDLMNLESGVSTTLSDQVSFSIDGDTLKLLPQNVTDNGLTLHRA
jgi:heat shock protein HslJ